MTKVVWYTNFLQPGKSTLYYNSTITRLFPNFILTIIVFKFFAGSVYVFDLGNQIILIIMIYKVVARRLQLMGTETEQSIATKE